MASAHRDKIYIRDLICRCIVGINPDERVNKQDVVINLTLEADLSQSCVSDQIEHTVDYKLIKRSVIDAVENSDFFLIERLAQHISDVCLKNQRIAAITVSVDKPGALRFAKSVAVEIFRER